MVSCEAWTSNGLNSPVRPYLSVAVTVADDPDRVRGHHPLATQNWRSLVPPWRGSASECPVLPAKVMWTTSCADSSRFPALRIRDEHPPANRIAAFEAALKMQFSGVPGSKHRRIAVDNQPICRAAWGRRRLPRDRSLLNADDGAGGEQGEDQRVPASHGPEFYSGARRFTRFFIRPARRLQPARQCRRGAKAPRATADVAAPAAGRYAPPGASSHRAPASAPRRERRRAAAATAGSRN